MTGALLAALLLAAPADAPSYTVARTRAAQEAVLGADEAAWSKAAAVEWGPAKYSTRFRALWTDLGLFLRFDATDPDPWHTMTRRDDHLWDEEVVEIFLDPGRAGHDYYELEISPANVVCEVRMIAPSPNKKQDFDWNLAGLQTRAVVHRDAAGKPTSWTATAFLPWEGLRPLPSAAGVPLPPSPGGAVALQRVPDRAPRRTEGAREGRRGGRVVADGRAELPRAARVPGPRLRRGEVAGRGPEAGGSGWATRLSSAT